MISEPKIITTGKHVRFMSRGTWEYVERLNITGIVGIIAITDDNQIVLVEQYRPPVNKNVIELPAGLVGDIPGEESEDLINGAKRELLEETGYRAQSVKLLVSGPTSPGLSNEIITLVLASKLEKVAAGGGDCTESIIVHLITIDSVVKWLAEMTKLGKLIDHKIYAGLYLALT